MPFTCPICFNDEKDNNSLLTLACNCAACVDCITQWITLKILENHYTIDSKTNCIMADCRKGISLQEIYQSLPPLQYRQKMDEALLQVYFSKQQDIRKCPNPNCKYAGIINTKSSCAAPLQCNLCGSTWRDKQHYTKFEKILDYLKNRPKAKAEDLSQAWIKKRSKKCPSCKVNIEKNGGCDHMTCKHCNYQFCWICLRRHPTHYQLIHSYHQNFIPLMAILLILSILIYFLYSFGIMLTLKFFVSGLAWLVSRSCILIAKLFYYSATFSVWWIYRGFTFFGWLIGYIIPYIIECVYFCFALVYNGANLLMWLIKNTVIWIVWLISSSVPYLGEFVSCSYTFIAQFIENIAHLFVWLVDQSTPFLMEFLSSSLTFLISLISRCIISLAWIIIYCKAFFNMLVDRSIPLLIEFITYCLSIFIKMISLSIPFLGWLIDCIMTLLASFTSCIFSFMQFSSQEDSSNLLTSDEFL